MARTRNASVIAHGGLIHVDDGELLDKEGKPINPIAHQSGETWTGVAGQTHPSASSVADMDQTAANQPPMPTIEAAPAKYRCDANTILRDMDGWMAFRLMDLALGGLSVTLEENDFRRLAADLKLHFRPVQ